MMGVTPDVAAGGGPRGGCGYHRHQLRQRDGAHGGHRTGMKAACPDALIPVQANAGLPQNIDGVDHFPETPEAMGRLRRRCLLPAPIWSAAVGHDPAHIRAIREGWTLLCREGRKRMRIAVITGASSGLGKGISGGGAGQNACRRWMEIWIIARRRDRLEALAKPVGRPKTVPLGLDPPTHRGSGRMPGFCGKNSPRSRS